MQKKLKYVHLLYDFLQKLLIISNNFVIIIYVVIHIAPNFYIQSGRKVLIMTKTQLIDEVAKKTGLKKKDADASVAAVVEAISDALVAGEKVQLVGFGTFEVKERAARTGINPYTKKAMKIPASKSLSFKAGKAMKALLNK